MKDLNLSLYAITDRAWLKDNESLADAVEQAIMGGATIIQLREKNLMGQELKSLALSVKSVCNKHGVPFIINDDVELAKEIGADGVHVGQSDMEMSKARQLLGPDAIIGVTAKTIEQAKAAEAAGADYLGSGALFGSTTKGDAKPMDFATFDEICQSVSIPVVAIGGIDETNVEELKGLHMAGIAVVSAIFAKDDKKAAAQNLVKLLNS